MTDKPHPDPGGTYGTADPASPARRDRWRVDQHRAEGPDPSLIHEPDDAGLESVPPESPGKA